MHEKKRIFPKTGVLAAGAMLAMFAFGPSALATPVRIHFSGTYDSGDNSGTSFSGYADLTLAPDPHASSTFPTPTRPHYPWDPNTQPYPPGTASAPADRVDPANAWTITGVTGMFNGHAITLGPAATGSEPSAHEYVPASLTKLLTSSGDPAASFDNLFYAGDSPLTCLWYYPDGTTDWKYPFAGGFFDPYGVLFTLDNGDLLDLWSNGVMPGGLNYGIKIIEPQGDSYRVVDSQFNGVRAAVPEPGLVWLFGAGVLGLFAWRRSAENKAKRKRA